MSDSRLVIATNNNNKGHAIVDWTQVPDDEIRYNTDDKEEVMKAKLKERKRHKWAREQAEAKRAERERAKAKRAEREAKERKVHEEEERWEAKHKHKAEAGKGDEASAGGASGEARGEVKKVVMDPSCTHCTQAQVICKFLVDSNKKQVACVQCNQSKGKCHWPGDGKDTKAIPKARGVAKGQKRKADKENAKAGPSKQKQAKTNVRLTEVLDLDKPEASGSRLRETSVDRYPGLEDKPKHLIDAVRLIANNLASLFKLHETAVKNSGWIANALESLLNESYGYGMSVTPPDLDSSEFDSDELCKEAEWLKTHGEDKEEESRGEDETMAETK
ncbi:hypothetical protein M404DRAFT_35152 [Pisolithus tinctorius Marx 270]|uniref:Uncharacterized protein n=1 Tax=Pisolithus tinctorius Marx 270 TaxID=870435 RepID=A0A0C3MZS1_PISTI|nr:hypothetical protein M404DRAFT_35152 [Pisolithus tinctorius Marx 270]